MSTYHRATVSTLKAVQLVRKGYLPRELPPPFTTEPLGDLLDSARASLKLAAKPWTEPTRHNLARVGGFRRPLKVPNPRHYILLAQTLEKHWDEIRKHVRSSNFAISRPAVTVTAERAVRPRYRLGEREKLRPRHWRGQRFVLRTDVSQFYPSVYTHAIPWALHGKAFAKANMRKTHGDQIDTAFRNGSNGQTVGIPIGPDASFVAAEILLTAVDKELEKQLGPLRGHRHFDDYELAFESRAEAEETQGHLEGYLGDLELVINPFKTRILELPQPFAESWTHQLSVFPIRSDTDSKTLTDAIALFSHAAESRVSERVR